MKKRTKHGHYGQARTARLLGKVPPAGKQSDCRSRRGGSDLASARCLHGSRAVRALSEVTVLCPFPHEQMSPTRRVGLLRARWWRCLGAITILDAVHYTFQ